EKTGQLITELRKEKGLTQKQLAEALNVTDKAVSKWERGLSFPDISMLEPISELLGVSIMEILAGERQSGEETMSRE
ncbi:MAG: helix-turn-helix transcriptional regulator, partial [Oscillospiraceae bacterium]|nr:helix-turn-helix transcriptional regulator [Oscillospiraceae bacterium]